MKRLGLATVGGALVFGAVFAVVAIVMGWMYVVGLFWTNLFDAGPLSDARVLTGMLATWAGAPLGLAFFLAILLEAPTRKKKRGRK